MSGKRALMMVNQSPWDCSLERPLKVLAGAASGGILLMQDGVLFAATDHGRELLGEGHQVYALRQSVEARGLSDRLLEGVELVDYRRVVDLIMEEYDVVM